jgi:hypothetical protein
MKSTDTKAKSGMLTYVLVIFAAALIIAGVYFVFLTPGEPEGGGNPHAGEGGQP